MIMRKQGVIVANKDLAIKFWIRQAIAETWLTLKQGKLCKLTVKEKDGHVVITGRA